MNSALLLKRSLTRSTKAHSNNNNNMNNMQAPRSWTDLLTSVGSMLASFMFFWTIIRQYFPPELRRFLERYFSKFTSLFNPYISIYIHEYSTGTRLKRSLIYHSVEAYLIKNSTKDAKRLKAEIAGDGKKIMYSMEDREKVTDQFQGVTIWWASGKFTSTSQQQRGFGLGYTESDIKYYKLTFHSKHREMITEGYLDHVLSAGKEITAKNRQRKLFTNGSPNKYPNMTTWSHIPFSHPASFDTMAMEKEKKEDIIDDLVSFSESKEYYAQIGKAWKRGYLLYGPPGTGKSTMIAAIANLLHYDVYDLELTAVKDNTELKKLLIDTASKSIIVIEDIDCSLDLTGQRKKSVDKKHDEEKKEKVVPKDDGINSKVTLSGLLNFIDGLWSASGGERIIVFTTNHVEKLDPALIRRGRMDKHIELTYCSFEGFKVFAKNYLKIDKHERFELIEKLIGETKITPADVAEHLMCKSTKENADKCLSNLIQALEEAKKAEAEKIAKQELKEEEVKKEKKVALEELKPEEVEKEKVVPLLLKPNGVEKENQVPDSSLKKSEEQEPVYEDKQESIKGDENISRI